MPVTDVSRTRATAGAVAVLVVAAGVGAILVSWTPDGSGPHPLRDVPARADAVAHVDADAAPFRNGTVRSVTLSAFAYQSTHPFYRGPRLDRWPRAFVEAPETPTDGARSLTGFVAHDRGRRNASYRATIVRSEWSTGAVLTVVERAANVTLEPTARHGTTTYVPAGADGPTVAVLPGGGHAIGTRPAVLDAVAVAAGDRDPVAGDLRTRYDAARPGYVTFVYPFPADAVPGIVRNTSAFRRAEAVSGVYYRNETTTGARLGAELAVHAPGGNAPRDIAAAVGAATELYQASADDAVLRRAAAHVRTQHQDGRAIIVYEDRVERVARLVDRLA